MCEPFSLNKLSLLVGAKVDPTTQNNMNRFSSDECKVSEAPNYCSKNKLVRSAYERLNQNVINPAQEVLIPATKVYDR